MVGHIVREHVIFCQVNTEVYTDSLINEYWEELLELLFGTTDIWDNYHIYIWLIIGSSFEWLLVPWKLSYIAYNKAYAEHN